MNKAALKKFFNITDTKIIAKTRLYIDIPTSFFSDKIAVTSGNELMTVGIIKNIRDEPIIGKGDSVSLKIPNLISIEFSESYKEGDNTVFILEPGDIFLDRRYAISSINTETLVSSITSGKLAIDYEDFMKLYLQSGIMNDCVYDVHLSIIGELFANLCYGPSGKLLREDGLKAGQKNRATEQINMKDITRKANAFSSIDFENVRLSFTKSLTQKPKKNYIHPIEEVVMNG